MRIAFSLSRARAIRWAAAILSVGLLILMLWAWSGIYSVAASRGHWPAVEWLLHFVMQSSARTHALGIKAPPLDDENQIVLGAGHFHSECASCHGAPGFPIGESARNMLPPPPPLEKEVSRWKDRELFWIVKNGIKYTGMPAFPSLERDDEVWAVVAFLRRLPELSENQYRDLAFGPLKDSKQSGRDIAMLGSAEITTGICARCHGSESEPPRSNLVPVLQGQSVEYLVGALRAYANGTRQSGIMQPPARSLSDEQQRKVAEYYAGLKQPTRKPDGKATGNADEIARNGIPAQEIPPCLQCHGADALPAFPRLAGQNAEYMALKLRVWKNGLKPLSDNAEIMAPIARRLSEQQIDELAAHFSQLLPNETAVTKRP
jgi:cytochrome c553